MHDRLVLLEAESLQHGIELIRPEDAHEIVFEREEEFGMPGISLPAGTPAQLVVDAPALVPLGAEHEQPTRLERLSLEPSHLATDFLVACTAFALPPSPSSSSLWSVLRFPA